MKRTLTMTCVLAFACAWTPAAQRPAASISIPSVTLWHQTCSGDCKGKTEPDRSPTVQWNLRQCSGRR
jgi:hypothetical protein